MYKNDFRNLIEIESLKQRNNLQSLEISAELARINHLNQQLQNAIEETKKAQLEITHLKLTSQLLVIQELETRLLKSKNQLKNSSTEKEQFALESQIKTTEHELSIKENIYLNDLEKNDLLQILINEKNQFIAGISKSIVEITNEVEINKKKLQNIIDQNNLRIKSLKEGLIPNLKNLYEEIEKNLKSKKAISYLIQKKCTECHIQVDTQLSMAIEECRTFETCPACSRFLIPESAKNFS